MSSRRLAKVNYDAYIKSLGQPPPNEDLHTPNVLAPFEDLDEEYQEAFEAGADAVLKARKD